MADGNKDVKLTAGIEGADEVGKAAAKALAPWESGAKKVGGALKGAFVGAFQDAARLVTVSNAISLDKAFESARKYRSEIGLLSATAGPVGQLRAQIDGISRQKLLREGEVVSAARGLGRITGSSKDALLALGALSDEAAATGETLTEKLPLGAALMNGLGTSAADVGSELGRVRTLADSLGTSGGLLAAEDRLTAMSGLLSEIGTKTDADRAKLEALALGLGNGLNKEAGKRASAAIIASISGNREQFAAVAGLKIGALTNADGSLNVDAALEAAQKNQAQIRRQTKDRGLQQILASARFGGDRQAGAAFLDADFTKIRAEAAAKPSTKTVGEADAYRKSEAGQAEQRQQDAERNARAAAEKLLPVADKLAALLSAHPIAGGFGANLGINLTGQLLGGLLGGLGKTLIGRAGGGAAGAAAAAAGVGDGARVFVTNWPAGFGGGSGVGGVPGLFAAGGADALLGSTFGVIAAPLAFLAAAALFAGKSLSELGEASKVHQGFDVVAISPEAAAEKAAKAKAAEEEARGHRSEGQQAALELERARIAKERGGGDPLETFRAAKKLGASTAEAEALAKQVQVTVKIENHSESPLVVNSQQQAGGLSN